MLFDAKRLATTATIALALSATSGMAASFSEVDANGDTVLTEQEFIDALGAHHGKIAYRQYNTDAQPITVQVEETVQATDADGNLQFEQGDPILVEDPETGNLVQATDENGNPLFEQGDPIFETIITDVQIEGVTVDEIRRSQRGFERSNAGKARAAANKQAAAEKQANAGNKSNNGKAAATAAAMATAAATAAARTSNPRRASRMRPKTIRTTTMMSSGGGFLFGSESHQPRHRTAVERRNRPSFPGQVGAVKPSLLLERVWLAGVLRRLCDKGTARPVNPAHPRHKAPTQ